MQAQGLLLLPGLIDSHVHLGISACGFKMVAAAGVTTCLDMSGTSDDLARIAKTNGAAINYGTLEAILPGKNVPTNDPSTEEIAAFVNKALANGSYGVKILGGHFPLTPKRRTSCPLLPGKRCLHCVACRFYGNRKRFKRSQRSRGRR